MLPATQYPYRADLLALEGSLPRPEAQQDQHLANVSTPLVLAEWRRELNAHLDEAFAQYLIRGISQGFCIGFDKSKRLQAATRNMQSAIINLEVVSHYLEDEAKAGRLAGPFSPDKARAASWQISRLGVIPKHHRPDQWRLIVDLSFSPGASVNHGIDPALCSLQYTRVDEVAKTVTELGVSTKLPKADIKVVYRLMPVHPDDRPLWLAMEWQGKVFIDTALPFGLQSAPKIFNAVADDIEWCVKKEGAQFLWHYLDDFITVGRAGTGECAFNNEVLHHVCKRLGGRFV